MGTTVGHVGFRKTRTDCSLSLSAASPALWGQPPGTLFLFSFPAALHAPATNASPGIPLLPASAESNAHRLRADSRHAIWVPLLFPSSPAAIGRIDPSFTLFRARTLSASRHTRPRAGHVRIRTRSAIRLRRRIRPTPSVPDARGVPSFSPRHADGAEHGHGHGLRPSLAHGTGGRRTHAPLCRA